jgi:hypothetical protein
MQKTLPLIQLKTIKDEPYQAGIDVVKKIVEKRADLRLFDESVLETLIKKTGGFLRELFLCINTSTKRAIRRKSLTISMEDVNQALLELKASITRRIDYGHYEFLKNICNGEHKSINNKVMYLQMLQAHVVLEYDYEGWHDVHPLIRDFLEDLGELSSGPSE